MPFQQGIQQYKWQICSLKVFRLHGTPKNIISDKDSKFMILFWQELLCGTELTPNTSYHPQTNRQFGIINIGQHKAWVKWLH